MKGRLAKMASPAPYRGKTDSCCQERPASRTGKQGSLVPTAVQRPRGPGDQGLRQVSLDCPLCTHKNPCQRAPGTSPLPDQKGRGWIKLGRRVHPQQAEAQKSDSGQAAMHNSAYSASATRVTSDTYGRRGLCDQAQCLEFCQSHTSRHAA